MSQMPDRKPQPVYDQDPMPPMGEVKYQNPQQQYAPAPPQSRQFTAAGSNMMSFGIAIVVIAVLYALIGVMSAKGIDAPLDQLVAIGTGLVVTVGAIGGLILPALFFMLRDKH